MRNLNARLNCLLFIFLLFSACVSKSDYAELVKENQRLISELDECSNGESRLTAIIEKAYSEKDYQTTRQNIEVLIEKHPESPRINEFQGLIVKIDKAEAAEKKRIEAEELAAKKKRDAEDAERIRLANLNNTGMWVIRHYVDEFGEPTKSAYIANRNTIKGVFSNTATQDSPLNVDFLISNSGNISIQLYEYAGNNPVKAHSPEKYKVLVQDKNSKRYNLTATNYSERLTFDKSGSWQVHSILLKGGKVMFKIIEIETPTTYYEFTINEAKYYDNAHRLRQES